MDAVMIQTSPEFTGTPRRNPRVTPARSAASRANGAKSHGRPRVKVGDEIYTEDFRTKPIVKLPTQLEISAALCIANDIFERTHRTLSGLERNYLAHLDLTAPPPASYVEYMRTADKTATRN